MYTVASFFSGIGGIDLAFAWAGFDIRFQCEIDTYCQQVLKKWRPEYWQNAVIKGDIHAVTKQQVGKVDVLVGGFPCQDVSIAGKREGIRRGNRSGLWFELLRIIREVRPRVALLENVAAIATPVNGQPAPGLIVAATLAEIGYDCTWQFVRAADVNAPHQRERWFCIAYDNQLSNPAHERLARGFRQPRNAAFRGFATRRRQRIVSDSGTEILGYTTSESSNGINHHARKRMVRKTFSKSGNDGRTSSVSIPYSVRYKRAGIRTGQVGDDKQRGISSSKQRRFYFKLGIGTKHQSMVNTVSRRLETTSERKPIKTQHSGLKYAGSRYSGASPKSRLGRASYGLSRRMDRHNGQFPSRPNEPQYDYEPTRTTDIRENRVARIRALGNAVVPQQVYPFAVAIKAFLDQTN